MRARPLLICARPEPKLLAMQVVTASEAVNGAEEAPELEDVSGCNALLAPATQERPIGFAQQRANTSGSLLSSQELENLDFHLSTQWEGLPCV